MTPTPEFGSPTATDSVVGCVPKEAAASMRARSWDKASSTDCLTSDDARGPFVLCAVADEGPLAASDASLANSLTAGITPAWSVSVASKSAGTGDGLTAKATASPVTAADISAASDSSKIAPGNSGSDVILALSLVEPTAEEERGLESKDSGFRRVSAVDAALVSALRNAPKPPGAAVLAARTGAAGATAGASARRPAEGAEGKRKEESCIKWEPSLVRSHAPVHGAGKVGLR